MTAPLGLPRPHRQQRLGAVDDPSHHELGHLGSEAQNGSAAADFDVVGVGTQAEELQRPSRLRRKNQG
jgi:hypothetical protein